ncbi:hypothetical protein ACJMK2_034308 [Sinanodonta woodiana]|uniref:SP-RING-type domain-containing protein n=1 Tax=Sinanodonta woodiana TaxID=1069815 RepID=A0ABD3WR64_SINWO
MWCEELGRLLLLRHQKNRQPDSKTPDMHPQIQKPMPPMPGDPNAAWAGGNPAGGPQQSLSVVTTVWGMSQAPQNGPYAHNTQSGYTNSSMSNNNYTQPPQAFPTNQLQKPAYNPVQNATLYRRDSGSYQRPSGYPPTPNTPGSNTPMSGAPNDYHAPPGALSAAALVAAAATATATATATASMVALQEQQNQQQQQQQQQMNMQMNMNNQYASQMQMQGQQPPYNSQYPGMSQRQPGPMSMGQGPGPGPGPGPIKSGAGMTSIYRSRNSVQPYPNPQQIMQQKRGPQMAQYPNGTQYGGPQGPYMNHQYPPKPQYPTQQPLPSPTYGGPQPTMRSNGQTQQYVNQFPPNRQPPQGQPAYAQFSPSPTQQNFQQAQNMNYPHSPLPGNPTPPMTPSNVPPYPGDIKPYVGDYKPSMVPKKDPDELRLTFPVRDGVVLPPFRLEHNLAVSNHVFHLRESVYQTLMWRSDLELQLKCFHHEDRQMNTNWPASVTVSVNATPLSILRGENKTSHKPLYLKNVCRPGRNTIQITVTACCCSHLFVLQLVHRPSVRSVLQGLLRKRLLPAEHCITKIKRNFTNVSSNTLNGEDGVEQTAIKVSLKCPITFRRITLPARGHDCKHVQCFDLESYLQLNCERGQWRCPVCNKPALLEGLEIDQYIWGILTNLASTEFEEVTIDPTASWKPVPIKTIKEEDTGGDPCSGGRWMKAMSPSSMQLPTMNSWDMGPQHSPYPMRPSSQGPPFSGSYGPGGEGPGIYPSGGGDFSGPLSHMPPGGVGGDMNLNSVNSMNSMNSMNSGDMMNKQMNPHGQFLQSSDPNVLSHQPSSMNNHLPPSSQSQAMNNCTSSNGSHPLNHHQVQSSGGNQPTSGADDLNFDPTAIIDGDPSAPGIELTSLDNLGDPIELLSYLGPPEGGDNSGQNGSNGTGNTNTGSNANNSSANNNNDDILAFFEA